MEGRPLNCGGEVMKIYTVKEAALRLCCSDDLVYQLCSARKLGHIRLGMGRGRIRIREEDIEEFLRGVSVDPVNKVTEPPKTPPVKLKHLQV